jgi:hypothetical protein
MRAGDIADPAAIGSESNGRSMIRVCLSYCFAIALATFRKRSISRNKPALVEYSASSVCQIRRPGAPNTLKGIFRGHDSQWTA